VPVGVVRVAVYSPDQIVFEGVRAMLGRHPERVLLVPPPRRPDEADPDVVLYDVLALLDGDTEPLRYLVDMTASKVLAAGRDLRPDLVGQALATGVDGFFSLGVDEDDLVAAVESAVTGWVEGDAGQDPTVGSSASAARANQAGYGAGLTEREGDVLALIAQGCSNQQIAEELYLSINSVKTYIRTAYRKIGVESRASAVSWALRHGFAAERRDQP
jgi:DNA-binding NarL/FixJ family response regulator